MTTTEKLDMPTALGRISGCAQGALGNLLLLAETELDARTRQVVNDSIGLLRRAEDLWEASGGTPCAPLPGSVSAVPGFPPAEQAS
jgi:hypothetical protein